jgi:hypothetical protein
MTAKIIWFGYALAAALFVYLGLKMMFIAQGSVTPRELIGGVEEIRGLIFLGFGVTWLAIASIGLKLNERK